MLCGLLLIRILYLKIFGCIGYIGLQIYLHSFNNALTVCTWIYCLCILLYKICASFQTAGIGVFAGRAFKQDEIVLRSSMILVLPRNIPALRTLRCYGFGHNETHMALDLDYGSIVNHHESANAEAVKINTKYYRVRGLLMCESQCSKTI